MTQLVSEAKLTFHVSFAEFLIFHWKSAVSVNMSANGGDRTRRAHADGEPGDGARERRGAARAVAAHARVPAGIRGAVAGGTARSRARANAWIRRIPSAVLTRDKRP